ncbi:hypothetical protein PHMEG_00025636 [Phytophthora megakarya]|uniref:Bzip transcription factor n=1 Tax=Phytophthora megakarya TaxID=4795 RepID=A0A225VCT6_9STRA|nr:hypothetical protein PHMEG_00025636 [Phytophthora megakarya]
MTSWNVVAEYFRLFRYGLKAPPSVENSRSTESLSSYAYPTHRNFLQATVAEDIVLDRGFGVDALMEDWKSISLHHQDLNISLVRLENGIGNSLVATVQAHCKISEDSIGHIFPHLVDDDDGEHARLVTKLVGQSLGIPCTICFVCDDATEEIVSMHYTSDMMTPLMRILGNLEDVSRVLGGSSAQLPVTGFSD